ncbi:MAG: NADP-dependent phosphogluconate dehydrogenase [Erysipelotrichaceae bacterium]
MNKLDIGIIGLSTMGKALALNMCDHQILVAGYNRSREVTEKIIQENHVGFHGFLSLEIFVKALSKPRKIMLMIQAGKAVDSIIEQLIPLLDKGDIIMDGGNSFYEDTIKRQIDLKKLGLYYYGVGISGGEDGARFGPSMMPSGDKTVYKSIKWIFEAIAARSEGKPCVTYIGENGSGHFVKMVHNGIEYADMQLISEAYLLLKQLGNFNQDELSAIFNHWNQGNTKSYLMKITAEIMNEKDDLTSDYLLNRIKSKSQQKGTGRWTSIEAMKLGMDVSLINSAGNARLLSNEDLLRSKLISTMKTYKEQNSNQEVLINTIHDALYLARLIAYAQGFSLLTSASKIHHWQLDLSKIADIFKAGCIIQSALLQPIKEAYEKDATLENLILDPFFLDEITTKQSALRKCVVDGANNGIPIPTMMNALAYLDALRNDQNGANLIQAQRDYFGAHTYERKDLEGVFHHEWGSQNGK